MNVELKAGQQKENAQENYHYRLLRSKIASHFAGLSLQNTSLFHGFAVKKHHLAVSTGQEATSDGVADQSHHIQPTIHGIIR